jgi:hypothetical protein
VGEYGRIVGKTCGGAGAHCKGRHDEYCQSLDHNRDVCNTNITFILVCSGGLVRK